MKQVSNSNRIWWEKTVEYTYLSLLPQGHVIAPLAGNFEAAGDAALHWDEYNWFLVEIKRRRTDFTSENNKYPRVNGEPNWHLNFLLEEVDKIRAQGNAEPHYLVYATVVENRRLMLGACRYWGSWFNQSYRSIVDTPAQNLQKEPILKGVNRETFNSYLAMLLAAKSNGSGTVSSGDFAVVMGISKVGSEIVSLALDDYIQEHGLSVVSKPGDTQEDICTPEPPRF